MHMDARPKYIDHYARMIGKHLILNLERGINIQKPGYHTHALVLSPKLNKNGKTHGVKTTDKETTKGRHTLLPPPTRQ